MNNVLELKRKAVELKRNGDLQGAKELLRQARELELEGVQIEDVDDPGKLKKMAIIFKRKGQVQDAVKALQKAKFIEANNKPGEVNENFVSPKVSVPNPPVPASTDTPEINSSSITKTVNSTNVSPIIDKNTPKDSSLSMHEKKPIIGNISPAIIEQSLIEKQTSFENNISFENDTSSMNSDSEEIFDENDPELLADYAALLGDGNDSDTEEIGNDYSLEDLLDVESLIDLKSIGGELPSKEDYDTVIVEYKKKALAFKKSGNIDLAKENLKIAKSLEAAYTKLTETNLSSGNDGDDIFGDDEMGGLSMDELMDPELLAEMHSLGMGVPTPGDMLDQAKEKKRQALAFKKSGDLANAKNSLKEAKMLEVQAEKLRELLTVQENDDIVFDEEALLKEEEQQQQNKSTSNPLKKKKGVVVAEEKPKTADELKKEAFELRKAEKLSEAAQKFREYKAQLEKENQAKKLAFQKQLIEQLNNEIILAKQQVNLLQFYTMFVDKEKGQAESIKWKKYGLECNTMIDKLKEGTEQTLCRKGYELMQLDENLEFIGKSVDQSLLELQIGLISIINLNDNTLLEKGERIKTRITIEIPPNENDSDGKFELNYDPKLPSQYGTIDYYEEKFVNIERGETKLARMVRRRMLRKKMKIELFVEMEKEEQSSSLWSFGKQTKPKPAPKLLGKVIIELKPLLETNFIAGIYPIMNSSNRKPQGGSILIGLATCKSYDPEIPANLDSSIESLTCTTLCFAK